LEICKLQSSYMFKVALATTVCYDKSCINYKKLEIKTLQKQTRNFAEAQVTYLTFILLTLQTLTKTTFGRNLLYWML
jgi:hypothetical protein